MKAAVKVYKVTHPSSPWMARYKVEGKTVRKYFPTEADAKRHAREIGKQLLEVGGAGVVMDASARAEWYACREMLAPLGVTMVEAVRDFVARAKVQKHAFDRPEFSEAVKLFLQQREDRGRKDRTVGNLKSRLEGLLRQGCYQWAEWNRPTLEKTVFGQGLSPRSCINTLSAARNFSRWCVKRGWLPVDPTDGIERPEAPAPTPAILTPAQLDKLLKVSAEVSPALSGWYAVLCLAGLRPSELKPMAQDLKACLRDGELLVHRVGKRHRETRTVPICQRLLKILDGLKWQIREPNPKRHQTLAPAAGITWQEDICRHSFVSYRLALTKNRAQVCTEAGHSEATLKRYYAVPVSEKQAKEWFGVKASGLRH